MLPRRFALIRHIDYTGVSGIGVVAYGVAFADGQVVLRWCSTHPATSMWNSIDDMLAIHGHGEATSVEWIDAPHGDLEHIPTPAGSRRRGRRRANRAAAPDITPGGNEDSKVPDERVAQRAARDNAPSPTSSGDDTAAESQPSNELPVPTKDRPVGSGTAGTEPSERPADSHATSESPSGRAILDDAESSGAESSAETPAVDDAASPRRERPILRSVRAEPETRAAPLLTSSEPDHRNGHLYIDTAPLLLTFREPDDEPAAQRAHRRGGRHRRVDPDAAG